MKNYRNPDIPVDVMGKEIKVGDKIAFAYSEPCIGTHIAVGTVIEYVRYKMDDTLRLDGILKVQDEVKKQVKGVTALRSSCLAYKVK